MLESKCHFHMCQNFSMRAKKELSPLKKKKSKCSRKEAITKFANFSQGISYYSRFFRLSYSIGFSRIFFENNLFQKIDFKVVSKTCWAKTVLI